MATFYFAEDGKAYEAVHALLVASCVAIPVMTNDAEFLPDVMALKIVK